MRIAENSNAIVFPRLVKGVWCVCVGDWTGSDVTLVVFVLYAARNELETIPPIKFSTITVAVLFVYPVHENRLRNKKRHA